MALSNDSLRGTPYLVPDDDLSLTAFNRVASRSLAVAERAREAQARIAQDATELLQPFLRNRRSDLVAESNQIEGYDVSRRQVQIAIESHRELLAGDIHGIMQAMRADPKLVTTLGLYKAQELADQWATDDLTRPRAYEFRQLHSLLVGDDRIGGVFRQRDVAIGGTNFRPPAHYDVPASMETYSSWWSSGTGDPVLDATVGHAWLTHIHPYEDGNGRLARLVANFALVQAQYPPLIVRAGRDRGEYYAALAESDEGNILPLYSLLSSTMRRTVKEMSSSNYTREFLEDRLLTSSTDQWGAWCRLAQLFALELQHELEREGWSVELQGLPDNLSFNLLTERDRDGNGWFLLVRSPAKQRRYLLWFGYNSDDMLSSLNQDRASYPSIFLSERDLSPYAMHPYAHRQIEGVPEEIVLKPLEQSPVLLRRGYRLTSATLQFGARELAQGLMGATPG